MPRCRIYVACSLDGFLAGPGDDLSWLDDCARPDAPPSDPGVITFEHLLSEVGALVMGRRTFEVVSGFDGPWPYGELPVLVATSRPLTPEQPRGRPVSGSIQEILAEAARTAGDRDIYLDGGHLVRQALDAGLVDEIVVTLMPVILGQGIPLFAGTTARHRLRMTGHHTFAGGAVQLHYRLA